MERQQAPKAPQAEPRRRMQRSRQVSATTHPGQSAILQLQSQLGNRAVTSLLRSHGMQAKLTIGQPGDPYEQEANRVADQVVRMPQLPNGNRTAVSGLARPLRIQRACPECEEELRRQPQKEEENLQAKSPTGEISPLIQRQVEPEEEGEQEALQTKEASGQSKVPSGLACPQAHDSPGGTHIDIMFTLNSPTLTALGLAAIENLVNNWHAAGGNEHLRLDGYASVEGTDAHNWTLSCNRANAVKKALITPPDGGPGIDSSYISEVFAQGETSGFGATHPPNRRVTIQLEGGTPEPTPTPTPTPIPVLPCIPLPTQIFSRGGCGSGSDFTFNDFQPLTGVGAYGRALVWQADNLSFNFRLRNDMRLELGLLGGSEGLRMVRHFSGGSGSTLTHGPSSTLGADALTSGTFSRLNRSVVRELESQLTSMAAAGLIDCNSLALSSGPIPAVSFSFSDGAALKGIIGGTQGLRILITNFSVNPVTRDYDIELQYLICDDFGVDTSDLYSPGLAAFWVLQHRRSGHVPFINELDLPVTASGMF